MIPTLFKNKKPFIGFVTAGDGGIDYCVECCLQLVAGGVDILEIGFPFSDPVADGITIQNAYQRVVQHVNADTIMAIAQRIRKRSSVPLILFSYLNPLLQQKNSFLKTAKSAGFDAVIVVDLAPTVDEITPNYYALIDASGLQPIYLIAPSTNEERIKMITKRAHGFLYYACQKGTTGVRRAPPNDLEERIQLIKKYTDVPIAVGFGIADRTSARDVLKFADGFVVGSAFVNAMSKKVSPIQLKYLAQSLDPRELAC